MMLMTGKKRTTTGGSGSRASGVSWLVSTYKKKARQRGYSWELTDEQAIELFLQNCVYCGAAPRVLGPSSHVTVPVNGIDRRDNTIGYVDGNVVSCCTTCNRIKGAMSVEDLSDYLLRISPEAGSGQK